MRLRSPAPTLPLLPLQAVLFPGGLLSLKVFEARYLDLVSSSLRERTPFGVVALRQATEPGQAVDPNAFEPIGVVAELLEVDAAQAGILHVRARGLHRFELTGQTLGAQGLWEATYRDIPDDVPPVVPHPRPSRVRSPRAALRKRHPAAARIGADAHILLRHIRCRLPRHPGHPFVGHPHPIRPPRDRRRPEAADLVQELV